MQDPKLDRRLVNVRELLQLWQEFHRQLKMCEDENRKFSPEEESEFLRIKSQIAVRHDALMESIEKNRENSATASAMMTVVENCILLRTMQKLSVAERKRMEIEWHDAYLLVNETIGLMEERQDKLAKESKFHHDMKRARENVWVQVKGFVNSGEVRFLAVFLGLVIGLAILPLVGVYDYAFIRDFPGGEKVYQLGQTFLRSTVMPGMSFENYDAFATDTPGIKEVPQGWEVVDIGDDNLGKIMTRLIEEARRINGEEPKMIDRYIMRKFGQRAGFMAVFFRSANLARDFEREAIQLLENLNREEYGEWIAAGQFKAVRRKANVAYLVISNETRGLEPVLQAKKIR